MLLCKDYTRDFVNMIADLCMKHHRAGNIQVRAMLESFNRLRCWLSNCGLGWVSFFFFFFFSGEDTFDKQLGSFGIELIRMYMGKDYQGICKAFLKHVID